jgi:hypothetical protein
MIVKFDEFVIIFAKLDNNPNRQALQKMESLVKFLIVLGPTISAFTSGKAMYGHYNHEFLNQMSQCRWLLENFIVNLENVACQGGEASRSGPSNDETCFVNIVNNSIWSLGNRKIVADQR